MEIIYIELELAITFHSEIINKSGGVDGFTNEGKGRLGSILFHMQNDNYYQSFLEKLVHLVSSIALFHVFIDGNKRSAIVLGAAFLLFNSFPPRIISNFLQEMENYIVWLVEHRITKSDLSQKLEYLIYDIEEPFEFKSYIFNKINK